MLPVFLHFGYLPVEIHPTRNRRTTEHPPKVGVPVAERERVVWVVSVRVGEWFRASRSRAPEEEDGEGGGWARGDVLGG